MSAGLHELVCAGDGPAHARSATRAPGATPENAGPGSLAGALAQVAAEAAGLDAAPRFPADSFAALAAAGVPQLAADRSRSGLRAEAALVRAVAAVDGSVARILDGHFNGVERLALLAPEELRGRELERVARDVMLVGVWGADPAVSEGPAAVIERDGAGALVLRGRKAFCSGAGGVARALVVAREADGARRLAYADVTCGMSIDRTWYRAGGLRSSESHMVDFEGARVLALLGGEDEIARQPWFARDSVRTAATWAGLADCLLDVAAAAVDASRADQLTLHSLGRMRVLRGTIDRWLEHAVERLTAVEDGGPGREPHGQAAARAPADEEAAATLALECRVALSEAARAISAEAVRACGSRALVRGGALDRARRDLDVFLLQHRLDPKLAQLGARALEASGE